MNDIVAEYAEAERRAEAEDDWNDHVCVCEHMDTQHRDGVGCCTRGRCFCAQFRLGEEVTYADQS